MKIRLTLLLCLLVGCSPDAPPPEPPKPEAPQTTAPAEAATVEPPSAPSVQPIRIMAWNVESGGAKPWVISVRLQLNPYDIYALSEVDPQAFEVFRKSCGDLYESLDGATGNGDRLQIIFNGDRFELVEKLELDRYRDWTLNNGNHRAPLVARLRDEASGLVFQIVDVHLARGKEEIRNEQAQGLREWARDQTLPTILIGDCNMDFDFKTDRGNRAFVELQRDNVWRWVRPKQLIDTNWADFNQDGKDDYPDSMLDFAFLAGPAKDWKATCKVLVEEQDFPDGPTKSDHRPIELIVSP